MRGDDRQQSDLFIYGTVGERVPKDHPLRPVREMADIALQALSPHFKKLYSEIGRPSIAPEKLLRALLLQLLYSIRSERLLMEQLEYNLLFRWFVGLSMNEGVWNHAVFSKNRERLLAGDIATEFFRVVVEQARSMRLLSDEHFTVDGTLIEAWASHKSFRPKGKGGGKGNDPGADFHGDKRRNQTHESRSDPESRLFRKGQGKEAKLSYMAHVLTENRNGLVVDVELTQAHGRAECEAGLAMAARLPGGQRRVTLGADKGYDTQTFVTGLRELFVTPHIAQNTSGRRSRIDRRTSRHAGYLISQTKRKRVEEVFGWIKTTAGLRKTRHRGRARVGWMFTFAVAAYNLVRMRNLLQATT
jgi:transposase